jgi:hypothetical protein
MIAFDPALAKLLLLALGAIVMLLWLGAMIVPLIAGVSGPRADPVQLRSLAPPILLVLCVVTILKGGEQAIVFSPPEVDFLFAGPFTRRRCPTSFLSRFWAPPRRRSSCSFGCCQGRQCLRLFVWARF